MKYLNKYVSDIQEAIGTLDDSTYNMLVVFMWSAAVRRTPVLVFGNGGSCAVAEHLSCDWTKGIAHDSPTAFPTVESLVSNQSLITAIANDYGYDQIFAKQIEYSKHKGAIALAISSSGNSPNVVNGLIAASKKGYPCVALVGFDGGRVVKDSLAALLTLHVKSYNYGLVEDCHSVIMHSIAQELRLSLASDSLSVKL